MTAFFDSHAHMDMARGGEDEVGAQLNRAWDANLVGIVTIAGATRVGEYQTALKLSEQEARVWVAAGIHPHTGSQATPDALAQLEETLSHERIVALGEIGLDYHYNRSTPSQQRQAFVAQMRIAQRVGLPVVIHTREADEDTIGILRAEGAGQLGGVIHCFSGGEALAEAALEMGLYLSFSGIVTFPKAEEVQAVAVAAPKDRILAETDSPFLSPIPFRGRVNEPARVVHVVEKLAELRQTDTDVMGNAVVENTCACFGIKLPTGV